jgi:capsular exopolysaccharide synthesis family protein
VLVTSGNSRDGKTFVASNFATALANSGKPVLLVDANLRHPALHAWFGIGNTVGFSDALSEVRSGGLADHDADVVGIVASSVQNLWILPAGSVPSNPAELLGSNALGQVIELLLRKWDAVVVDSPPIGVVADALLLARQTSGCVIVARSGVTRRAALRSALAALNGIDQPILGVVLNDERTGPLARFTGDDYYHFGYLHEESFADRDSGPGGPHNGHIPARARSGVEAAPREGEFAADSLANEVPRGGTRPQGQARDTRDIRKD